MQRSARPKSAKGKTRPTPPSYPRVGRPEPETSRPTSRRTARRGPHNYGTRRNDSSNGETQAVTGSSFQSSQSKESATEHVSEASAPDPSEFPEISRPISSLSRYDILPRIPATPGQGDGRASSPVESEFELDLMSSFAQQMILDSAKINVPTKNTLQNNQSSKRAPAPPKRVAVSEPRLKQSGSQNHDSPVHKKPRPAVQTKSVFGVRGNNSYNRSSQAGSSRQQEPKEGEPRLKLALKLPDGKRIERYFSPANTVNDIMNFAQTKMRVPMKRCNVYSMLQVPKILLKNWKQTLEQLDLRDRTMLYIEEKD